MSSLLVLSSSTSCSRPCPSPLLFSSRSPSLDSFLLQTRRRCRLRVRASRASETDGFASAGYSKAPSSTLPKSRREILLEYVKNVQPEFMELFIKRAPQQRIIERLGPPTGRTSSCKFSMIGLTWYREGARNFFLSPQ